MITEDNATMGSHRPLTMLPLESNVEFGFFQDSPERQSQDDELSILPGQREKGLWVFCQMMSKVALKVII